MVGSAFRKAIKVNWSGKNRARSRSKGASICLGEDRSLSSGIELSVELKAALPEIWSIVVDE
jgi:hypothetical protein